MNPSVAVALALVRSCPHAGASLGCPCNGVRRCSKLATKVSMIECLRCVRAANATLAPNPAPETPPA